VGPDVVVKNLMTSKNGRFFRFESSHGFFSVSDFSLDLSIRKLKLWKFQGLKIRTNAEQGKIIIVTSSVYIVVPKKKGLYGRNRHLE
jgi:hypothetical protein